MTDKKPPRDDRKSSKGPRRRIAPTKVSSTPRSSRSRLRISYPFHPRPKEESQVAADADDEDDSTTEDTRSQAERDLIRLSHSFFERRSDSEGSEEVTVPVVETEPSPRYNDLIPPRAPSNRYFNLVSVPGRFCYDPATRDYVEVFELQWSSEHIEPIPGQGLTLKLVQEYPDLIRLAEVVPAPIDSVQVDPMQERQRMLVGLLSSDLQGIARTLFLAMGSRISFMLPDGTRIRGTLYRARPDNSILVRNPESSPHSQADLVDYYDYAGNAFTILPLDSISDLQVERMPSPGRPLVAILPRPRNPRRISSEVEDQPRDSRAVISHTPPQSDPENAPERLGREHQAPDVQSNFSITDCTTATLSHIKNQLGLPMQLDLGMGDLDINVAERQEHHADELHVQERSAPLLNSQADRFENVTLASYAMDYSPQRDVDSPSDDLESHPSDIEGSSWIRFDARESDLDAASWGNTDSPEGSDQVRESIASTSSHGGLRRSPILDANTQEDNSEASTIRQPQRGMDYQGWLTLSGRSYRIESVGRLYSSGVHYSPPPRQIQPDEDQEGDDSDPDGLYNASPPRRPRPMQQQQGNEPSFDQRTQAANQSLQSGEHDSDPDGLYNASPPRRPRPIQDQQADEPSFGHQAPATNQLIQPIYYDSDPDSLYNASPPSQPRVSQRQANESPPDQQSLPAVERSLGSMDLDETEEYGSLQSRTSAQEDSSSSSDETPTSRGRSMKKRERKGKNIEKKYKRRSRDRR